MSLFDHIAIKSNNVAADVEKYRQLGFHVEACFEDWGMVRDEKGTGIALLGPGSHHPTHFAIRVADLAELEKAAAAENRPLQKHRDETISFYTNGAQGVALEYIWYPPTYGAEKAATKE
jgi:hypothetical protein